MASVRFRLSEVAARAGVTRDTIRYYERSGLLELPARTVGRRSYGLDTVERVRLVRQLQTCGLTIGDIRAVLRGGDVVSRRTKAILRARAEFIGRRLAEMTKCHERLQEAIRLCGDNGASLSAAVRSLPPHDSLAPFRFGRTLSS
jgi:DNA-binding transcriptional MerR regulator